MYEISSFTASISISEEPAAFRAGVLELQEQWKDLEQVETPIRHYFAAGMYAREMTIPSGTFVIGKIHRHQHISTVSKGDITVFTEFGKQRIKAPYTLVAEPGTKRAVYTHEETVWTTFHATNETDLEKLEAELIAPDYESFEMAKLQDEVKCLGEL